LFHDTAQKNKAGQPLSSADDERGAGRHEEAVLIAEFNASRLAGRLRACDPGEPAAARHQVDHVYAYVIERNDVPVSEFGAL